MMPMAPTYTSPKPPRRSPKATPKPPSKGKKMDKGKMQEINALTRKPR